MAPRRRKRNRKKAFETLIEPVGDQVVLALRKAAVEVMNNLAEQGPAYSGDFSSAWYAVPTGQAPGGPREHQGEGAPPLPPAPERQGERGPLPRPHEEGEGEGPPSVRGVYFQELPEDFHTFLHNFIRQNNAAVFLNILESSKSSSA